MHRSLDRPEEWQEKWQMQTPRILRPTPSHWQGAWQERNFQPPILPFPSTQSQLTQMPGKLVECSRSSVKREKQSHQHQTFLWILSNPSTAVTTPFQRCYLCHVLQMNGLWRQRLHISWSSRGSHCIAGPNTIPIAPEDNKSSCGRQLITILYPSNI